MRPVCSDCEKEMRPIQNGVLLYHPMEPADENEEIDFTARCDEYECPECGHKIITGCGERTLSTTEDRMKKNREFVEMAKKRGTSRKMLR